MNFIHTFWSCNNKNLLKERFGWYSPQYNLMSWTLSCLQLKKYHDKIILNADSNVAKTFIDILKLPYSEVISDLDKLNNYNTELWAIPKIYVYSIQEKPFISIDGDAFIWEPLNPELLKQGLIAQNLEADEPYYKYQLESIKEHFSFIPDEALMDLGKREKIQSYNAGIFGGSDIQFFKEYTAKAFEFVNKNIDHLHKINIPAFNAIYEQYLFYCLSKKQHKKVSVFIPDIVDDIRYKGFADFLEVPYNKKYLHLHGAYKKSYAVCQQMANRLRNDYPEYYYRIINLFKENNLPLVNDAYSYTASMTEKDLAQRFYFLKKGSIPSNGTIANNLMPFTFWRSEMCNKIFGTKLLSLYPDHQIQQLMKETLLLEQRIVEILKDSYLKIDKDELYQIDILSTEDIERIFTDKKNVFDKELVISKHCQNFQSPFDWTLLNNNNEIPLDIMLEKLLESLNEGNYTVIVPECFGEGFSLYNADELDLFIIEKLQTPKPIGVLLQDIVDAFDPEELKDGTDELRVLVYNRIKSSISNKIIKWHPGVTEFRSLYTC